MTSENDIEKSLSLLEFALNKRNVNKTSYEILRAGSQPQNDEDVFCLREEIDSSWQVFYLERGKAMQTASFERYQDAMKYFFWKLTDATDQWSFREQWEQETKKKF